MEDFIFQEVLHKFETIDSTNEEAKRMLKTNPQNLFVITAKEQTKGKGRVGRSWQSGIDGNVYMTITINSSLILEGLRKILPLYVAFTIIKALESKLIQYKWPNDLMIEGKKFCGILVEKQEDFFIIGIGININPSIHYKDFNATCLTNYNIAISADKIFESFKKHINTQAKDVIMLLKDKFFTKEKFFINNGEFVGFFENITEEGELVIKLTDSTKKTLTFGDVSAIM